VSQVSTASVIAAVGDVSGAGFGAAARRIRTAGMRFAAILVLAVALAACGSSGHVAQGIVTGITPDGPVGVARFEIRTTDGATLDFRVGTLELDGGAFPAEHLGEHRLTAQPVAVSYRDEDGELVAYRLEDAPSVK
jgi:hypothetical protein